MRSPWQYLRGWFARVGSDPYYASYDRSLGNIKAELDRIQAARAARHKAWAAIRARFLGGFAAAYAAVLAYAAYVNHQPPGTYRPAQQAARVAPAFLAPPLGWAAHRLLGWLQAALDARAARRVRQLDGKLRKQVSELKDSTRYQRTLALLQKYDPDYVPPKLERTPSARGGRQPLGARAPAGGGGAGRAAGAAVNAAGSALQGAGSLFPALAQLYSRAADTLIADDPVTLGLLREAQQQSDLLRQRLMAAEGRSVALLRENIALKQQLGQPAEEEQAALAAWTAGGGGGPGAVAAHHDAPAGAAEARQLEGPAADEGAAEPQEAAEEEEACLEPGAAAPAAAGAASGSPGRVSRRRRGSSSGS
ncbi:hypothetical protein CHLNCDRAFT_142061 [Chlorella variabilis]|uniref:Uncharacterized protein n=1 Tax=Chlorella variabilis TaxID=554065 RepID=E1Z7N7_CHLVA|nr:hypothetical protein CHLNCDRAFT_142061 [Chlorella variabilis]EFN58202.1 hypothetical protein CHLNCDRAFT_142061 [Chlorella variabilis]|eukprot:XP_005850304.1 hypothetical protein CHLNCDRAFT_142061 [Chlorella variabilis]